MGAAGDCPYSAVLPHQTGNTQYGKRGSASGQVGFPSFEMELRITVFPGP
jgi:hypothetical protein